MFESRHLKALSAVLRTGSFESAAAALGVTQSAISQRIRSLEDQVGATLVIRGQPCTATETGRRCLAHAEKVDLLETDLRRDLGLAQVPPRFRIAVNADSLATWFLSALAEVDGTFEIMVDDQDHSAELLRSGSVVAAVTADGDPVQGCDRVSIGAMRYVATASPDFARRWFPEGVTTRSLWTAPALQYNEKDALQRAWAKRMTGQVRLGPLHQVPSTTAFVEAAVLGMGWGMNPAELVKEALSKGVLVDLSDEMEFSIPLYWQFARAVKGPLLPLTRSVQRIARARLQTH